MAKLNLRKAKFYCESCGSEVPQNARFCNTCGKFFTFVRCPKCQYSGESKQFTNGCPKCGYAVKPYRGSSSSDKNKNDKGSFSFSSLFGSSKGNRNQSTEDSSLPVWIYIAVIIVLVAVVLGLYSCL